MMNFMQFAFKYFPKNSSNQKYVFLVVILKFAWLWTVLPIFTYNFHHLWIQQIHDSFRAQCLFLIKLYSSHGERRDPRYVFLMASQALKFHANLKLRAVTERPMAGNGT